MNNRSSIFTSPIFITVLMLSIIMSACFAFYMIKQAGHSASHDRSDHQIKHQIANQTISDHESAKSSQSPQERLVGIENHLNNEYVMPAEKEEALLGLVEEKEPTSQSQLLAEDNKKPGIKTKSMDLTSLNRKLNELGLDSVDIDKIEAMLVEQEKSSSIATASLDYESETHEIAGKFGSDDITEKGDKEYSSTIYEGSFDAWQFQALKKGDTFSLPANTSETVFLTIKSRSEKEDGFFLTAKPLEEDGTASFKLTSLGNEFRLYGSVRIGDRVIDYKSEDGSTLIVHDMDKI